MLKLLFGGLISLFRSRRDLALENLVLRHQLHVVLRTNPSPSLLDQDRIFWVWTRRLWPSGWRDHLVIVRPSTVLRWHRKGWRLYWSWNLLELGKEFAGTRRQFVSSSIKGVWRQVAVGSPAFVSDLKQALDIECAPFEVKIESLASNHDGLCERRRQEVVQIE